MRIIRQLGQLLSKFLIIEKLIVLMRCADALLKPANLHREEGFDGVQFVKVNLGVRGSTAVDDFQAKPVVDFILADGRVVHVHPDDCRSTSARFNS